MSAATEMASLPASSRDAGGAAGIVRIPLSDDARSQIAGSLSALRTDLRTAGGRGDGEKRMHVANAIRRIDDILDARK